ncbi:YunG family protein [Shinella sumterensis]|uniref:Uncharacterized protein n=1 Tax=Shinella sumterensis TaxID=1967501 RepID=A0AA50H457_9HYPH|nr:hypothetical protein [Shinella sumterensis]WLR97349.1 hypothetical protein Q9313_16960 [Shinella sumterensis]
MLDTPNEMLPMLYKSWSTETGSQWLPENPARGQCNVTSLVVQDMFGGEILKTEVPGAWHFYNRIGGVRYDLTSSQFSAPIQYMDIESTHEEALSGTGVEQYATLKNRINNLRRAYLSENPNRPSKI